MLGPLKADTKNDNKADYLASLIDLFRLPYNRRWA